MLSGCECAAACCQGVSVQHLRARRSTPSLLLCSVTSVVQGTRNRKTSLSSGLAPGACALFNTCREWSRVDRSGWTEPTRSLAGCLRAAQQHILLSRAALRLPVPSRTLLDAQASFPDLQ
eukprot:946238-Rhodomonas_salina.1